MRTGNRIDRWNDLGIVCAVVGLLVYLLFAVGCASVTDRVVPVVNAYCSQSPGVRMATRETVNSQLHGHRIEIHCQDDPEPLQGAMCAPGCGEGMPVAVFRSDRFQLRPESQYFALLGRYKLLRPDESFNLRQGQASPGGRVQAVGVDNPATPGGPGQYAEGHQVQPLARYLWDSARGDPPLGRALADLAKRL